MLAALDAAERAKYRRMWARPEYRTWSPGAGLVGTFLAQSGAQPGETVLDLGCGTGRAGAALAKAGLAVTLVDFVAEAVDPEARALPFVEACLWDLPDTLGPADWIFCTDVLEHLPPEAVGPALDAMAARTRRGGLLSACTVPDGCGALIGERLHLTLQPAAWWHAQLQARWADVRTLADGVNATLLVGEGRGAD